ncbi:VanZ like protein [Alteromonadaceae bacterium 2753L.S.0a.02]|nr:VanZ like protein [Alteromonadaceae bacterium 2753L.S.0a.02]
MSFFGRVNRVAHFIFFSRSLAWLRYSQLVAAIAIFAYFALRPPTPQQAHEWFNVTAHFSGNVLLALSVWLAFLGRWKLRYLLVCAFCYSMAIEMAQGLTPARSPNLNDAMVNTAGLFVGVLICLGLQRWLRQVERLEHDQQAR